MSRDDSGSFLGHYLELEILKKNPFASIDQAGVRTIMKIAPRTAARPATTSSWAFVANMAANPSR